MNSNRQVICAGCNAKFYTHQTKFHRKKRWCGSSECLNVIDTKVKHANYKKQRKKMESGKFRHGVVSELREYIKMRDKLTCRLCKMFLESNVLQVHHIIPVSNGGTDDKKNLVLLCYHCHTKVHQQGHEKYVDEFTKYSSIAESVTQ